MHNESDLTSSTLSIISVLFNCFSFNMCPAKLNQFLKERLNVSVLFASVSFVKLYSFIYKKNMLPPRSCVCLSHLQSTVGIQSHRAAAESLLFPHYHRCAIDVATFK